MTSFDTFELWWAELVRLATTVGWPLATDPEEYREYFDDGDAPEGALQFEMDYCDDDDESLEDDGA